MRVISGIHKGRKFEIPHTFKARPTTDFAKENLFNILANRIDFENTATALDLFSGTGSIGIEMVSRGCRQVISIEKDPQNYAFICKVKEKVKANNWFPVRCDVFKYIKKCDQKFDLIFADPPYELEDISSIPELVFEYELLNKGGWLVLEHGKKSTFYDHPFFTEKRTYGSVNFSFFLKKDEGVANRQI